MPNDLLEQQLGGWASEFPGSNRPAKAVVLRILRLARLLSDALAGSLENGGVSGSEWSVLFSIRAAGPPYASTPRAINRVVGMSSGGLTNLVSAMEARGLVERRPNPDDSRSVLVALTRQGHEVVDAVAHDLTEREERLLAALGPAEQRRLADGLATLLASLERS